MENASLIIFHLALLIVLSASILLLAYFVMQAITWTLKMQPAWMCVPLDSILMDSIVKNVQVHAFHVRMLDAWLAHKIWFFSKDNVSQIALTGIMKIMGNVNFVLHGVLSARIHQLVLNAIYQLFSMEVNVSVHVLHKHIIQWWLKVVYLVGWIVRDAFQQLNAVNVLLLIT